MNAKVPSQHPLNAKADVALRVAQTVYETDGLAAAIRAAVRSATTQSRRPRADEGKYDLEEEERLSALEGRDALNILSIVGRPLVRVGVR